MPHPKDFPRADYRRALYWKAKRLKFVKVHVDGTAKEVALVRKVDDPMRQWITPEEEEQAKKDAAEHNASL